MGEAMEFFAHGRDPQVFEGGIVLEFPILCDGLFRDGMDNTKTVVFNIVGWRYMG